ncbi:Activating transcription factor 7-interacting protein 1 [Sparganum proliferum]
MSLSGSSKVVNLDLGEDPQTDVDLTEPPCKRPIPSKAAPLTNGFKRPYPPDTLSSLKTISSNSNNSSDFPPISDLQDLVSSEKLRENFRRQYERSVKVAVDGLLTRVLSYNQSVEELKQETENLRMRLVKLEVCSKKIKSLITENSSLPRPSANAPANRPPSSQTPRLPPPHRPVVSKAPKQTGVAAVQTTNSPCTLPKSTPTQTSVSNSANSSSASLPELAPPAPDTDVIDLTSEPLSQVAAVVSSLPTGQATVFGTVVASQILPPTTVLPTTTAVVPSTTVIPPTTVVPPTTTTQPTMVAPASFPTTAWQRRKQSLHPQQQQQVTPPAARSSGVQLIEFLPQATAQETPIQPPPPPTPPVPPKAPAPQSIVQPVTPIQPVQFPSNSAPAPSPWTPGPVDVSALTAPVYAIADNTPISQSLAYTNHHFLARDPPPSTTVLPVAPLPPWSPPLIPTDKDGRPTVLRVQPPLRLVISSADEGVCLRWELGPFAYAYEPATSYEVYSYASSDVQPSAVLTSRVWQKVGEVQALALPMACTLTSVITNNIYYFIVRSLDRFHRPSDWSNVVNAHVS